MRGREGRSTHEGKGGREEGRKRERERGREGEREER